MTLLPPSLVIAACPEGRLDMETDASRSRERDLLRPASPEVVSEAPSPGRHTWLCSYTTRPRSPRDPPPVIRSTPVARRFYGNLELGAIPVTDLDRVFNLDVRYPRVDRLRSSI